jgi:transposase
LEKHKALLEREAYVANKKAIIFNIKIDYLCEYEYIIDIQKIKIK